MKTYKEAFLFTLISLLLIGGVIWVGIGEEWRAKALKDLALICPISKAMLAKIRIKESKKYKFIWEKT